MNILNRDHTKTRTRNHLLAMVITGSFLLPLFGCGQTAVPNQDVQPAKAATMEESTLEETADLISTEDTALDTEEETGAAYQLPWDVQSEEDLQEFITGSWAYYGRGKAPNSDVKLGLTIHEDGTFELLHTVDEIYRHEGTWKLDRLYHQEDALPDLIEFTFTSIDHEDEDVELIPIMGDFLFDNFAVQGNDCLMGWRQVNNGDSIFWGLENDSSPIWYKTSDKYVEKIPEQEPLRNAECGANLWYVEQYGDDYYLYLSPYDCDSKIGIVTEYLCTSDEKSAYPMEALTGFSKILITTDENGQIIDVDKYMDDFNKELEEESGPREDNVIADYVRTKVDRSVTVGNREVAAYFEKPVFIGRDKKVKWLNQQITKIQDSCEYSPYSLGEVYYDADGNVSIAWTWEWFMGGVSNHGYVGYNVNINTKEVLKLEDLLGITREELNQQIADKLVEDYGEYIYADAADYVEKLGEVEEIRYHYDQFAAYVGFDSYELDQGNFPLEVTLRR